MVLRGNYVFSVYAAMKCKKTKKNRRAFLMYIIMFLGEPTHVPNCTLMWQFVMASVFEHHVHQLSYKLVNN